MAALIVASRRNHRLVSCTRLLHGSKANQEAKPDQLGGAPVHFQATAGQPIDYAEFRRQLRESLGVIAAQPTRAITTADPAQLPVTEPPDAGPGPAIVKGAPLGQAPSDRGEPPRRIEPQGEINPDLPHQ